MCVCVCEGERASEIEIWRDSERHTEKMYLSSMFIQVLKFFVLKENFLKNQTLNFPYVDLDVTINRQDMHSILGFSGNTQMRHSILSLFMPNLFLGTNLTQKDVPPFSSPEEVLCHPGIRAFQCLPPEFLLTGVTSFSTLMQCHRRNRHSKVLAFQIGGRGKGYFCGLYGL